MKATHRAITAHTMAEVLEGRYNHKIRSVRIIDCRYCLLKITFVRINANMFNVQLSIFKVQIWIWRRPYTRGWELATWRGTQFIFKLKKSTSNDWTKIVHYACFCSGWRISERVLSSLEASSFQSPRQLRRSNVSRITDNLNSINITSSPFNLLQAWQCRGREARHLGLPLRILQQERARLLHKAEDQGQEHQQGCLPRALLSWGILVKYCSFKESIWICFPGISASEGLQGVLDSPPWPVCRRLHRDGQPTVFAAFTHMQVALIYIEKYFWVLL